MHVHRVNEWYSFGGAFPFMILLLVVFLLGMELLHVNQMDVIYDYTYQKQYFCPGTLDSDRLSKFWWTELVAGRMRVVFFALSVTRVAAMGTPWIANMQMFFALFYLGAEAANVVVWGLEIQHCNEVEGNFCNDYKWCGVTENAQNSTFCPKNFCTSDGNTSSCPLVNVTAATPIPWHPPVVEDDLHWNTEFLIQFGTSLALFVVALVFTGLSYLSMRRPVDVVYNIGGKEMQPTKKIHDFTDSAGTYEFELNSDEGFAHKAK